MKKIYSILSKALVLLPFMWLYRMIDIFNNRGSYTRYKMDAILKADRGKAEEQEKLFASVISLLSRLYLDDHRFQFESYIKIQG